MELGDRVAVITGASRGIGAGLARVFASRGMKLGLCARGAPAPGELPELPEDRLLFRRVDVADAAAVDLFADEVAERLGPIDLWVNNAGLLAPIGAVRELDPASFATQVGVNLNGVFHGTRSFLARLHAAERSGTLINIGSGAATSAYAGWGVYCATKAAVDHLTRVIAMEEEGSGIRVFSLAPGVIATRMQEEARAGDLERFPILQRLNAMHDESQLLDPESPAPAILRLAFGPEITSGPIMDVRESPELADLDAWR